MAIPHAVLPEPNIIVTIGDNSPTKAVPLVLDVLALVDALIGFPAKTAAARISI